MTPLEICCGIIYSRDGRILISRRMKGTHLADFWEFPGGKWRAGELYEETVEREIYEEVDIRVFVRDTFYTKDFMYPDRYVRLRFFKCEYDGSEDDVEDVEVAEHRWVFPHELRDFTFPPANEELLMMLCPGSIA